jgi:hypothetical protein
MILEIRGMKFRSNGSVKIHNSNEGVLTLQEGLIIFRVWDETQRSDAA